MESFVKYIEFHLLEKRAKLEPDEINKVVQFNIKRKQIIEQLIALLKQDEYEIGLVFEKITENVGMHISVPQDEIPRRCCITHEECVNGRIICLCENIDRSVLGTSSFQFYCRSDVVKYLRYFYFVQHFNFFVMMRIYETTVEERWGETKEQFMNNLQKQFDTAYAFLAELVRPLEFKHVVV